LSNLAQERLEKLHGLVFGAAGRGDQQDIARLRRTKPGLIPPALEVYEVGERGEAVAPARSLGPGLQEFLELGALLLSVRGEPGPLGGRFALVEQDGQLARENAESLRNADVFSQACFVCARLG